MLQALVTSKMTVHPMGGGGLISKGLFGLLREEALLDWALEIVWVTDCRKFGLHPSAWPRSAPTTLPARRAVVGAPAKQPSSHH